MIKINQEMIPYRKTGLHKYGHTKSITVPKNQFINPKAKYIPYISTDGKYILYKQVSPSPKNPFKNPKANYHNLKKFMNGNNMPTDFQGKPVGKENI